MTYHPTDQLVGYQPIADVSTTQKHPLGTIVRAIDQDVGMGEFIYLKGVAHCEVGSWLHYNADDFSTTKAVADGVGPLAIAVGSLVADTYGWCQIGGKASGLASTSFADNGNCYLTALVGEVDDTVVDGDYIRNAKGASTITTAGLADFEIARPFTTNDLETGS